MRTARHLLRSPAAVWESFGPPAECFLQIPSSISSASPAAVWVSLVRSGGSFLLNSCWSSSASSAALRTTGSRVTVPWSRVEAAGLGGPDRDAELAAGGGRPLGGRQVAPVRGLQVAASGAGGRERDAELAAEGGRQVAPVRGLQVAASGGAGRERDVDVAIVGGGIVGLATARQLLARHPSMRVAILEKEKDLVPHQTSHNSGVIHAGIYYAPGSDMARLCVDGAERMYAYCEAHNIPHKRVGKLIVATSTEQLPIVDDLFERASTNGVKGLEIIGPRKIEELEPNVRALRALHSPNTGIVDYAVVGRQMAKEIAATGRGEVKLGFHVRAVEADSEKGVEISDGKGQSVKAGWLITCAGLQSDTVGQLAGGSPQPRVLPFRGTYHELKPEYRNVITRNIYPVPDPRFPMVGVHLTPRIDGRVLIGPNAALAAKKEGYSFWQMSVRDLAMAATNPGLWRLVLRNPLIVLGEVYRDLSPRAFVAEAQKYCPSLKLEHTTSGWAGVHAVAITPDGGIVGDFVFETAPSGRVLNVRNAPSPACTASLAIGEEIANRAASAFNWPGGADGRRTVWP